MEISSITISDATGLNVQEDVVCDCIGMSFSSMSKTLSFLDDKKYLKEINNNLNITAVLTKTDLVNLLRDDIKKVICDDPRYYFYILQNYLSEKEYVKFESLIDDSSKIHSTAYISDTNVILGRNVVIEPKVIILPGVEIGDSSIVRAGAILGAEGFEHKRTSRGILSVKHDGKVVIGARVDIGAGSSVAKGFSYRNTIIGNDTKIDNLVHIAHAAQIGSGCFIAAGTITSGSIDVGNNVWFGPNSTISNRVDIKDQAFISLGAVVVNDLQHKAHVSGNFAVQHKIFLRFFTKLVMGKL